MRVISPLRRLSRMAALFALLLLSVQPAAGQRENPLEAVVGVRATIPAESRSAATLGREREGSGVVIDDGGLVLTIGYLILEATEVGLLKADGVQVSADVVAYDAQSGFGLVRAREPLRIEPIRMGRSEEVAEGQAVLVAAFGGREAIRPAVVVSRREFAGSWEYLLEGAIFTAPIHPYFSGAALIGEDARLIGIGYLAVGSAGADGAYGPGNMFVPIERLAPILGDLLAEGRSPGPPRPWLGLNAEEVSGRLLVARVAEGGPAQRGGIRKGDIVVGVAGRPVSGLAEFYRAIWAQGEAGVAVTLTVLQGASLKEIVLRSIDRYAHYGAGSRL